MRNGEVRSNQEVLQSIKMFIELEGYRKEYLAKQLKMELDEFNDYLNGEKDEIDSFAKDLAKVRGYNVYFFLDGRAEMYNKSQVLGRVLNGESFEEFVPKENINIILNELVLYKSIDKVIEEKERALNGLKQEQIMKRLNIENLL